MKRRATARYRARVATAAAFTGALLAAGVVTGQAAQANVSSGSCRLSGYASEPGGILLKPCSIGLVFEGSDQIGGEIYVQNPNHMPIDVCAQVERVNANGTTSQAYNLECVGWSSSATQDVYAPNWWGDPSQGTYVVQAGYWATINGVYAYYGGAQSGRIQEF
ncbi:hypothetical protein [Streptomyces sp. NPDC127190]|uniref:hypothetical protein n=1 Tax=unclassified Streptomyces TaxID=2593676 RepID=UPI003644ADAF